MLLMVLVHMTGDMRWLEPPYKPKRDIRLIPDPEAGVPKEIQDEIRAAVLELFANGEPKPAITDPGDELMLKMMRACLGENVAPEYAPLMREEMGFVPREARWTKPPVRRAACQAACADRRRGRLRHRARRRARPARHSLYHRREERRARRHLVRQSISRLRRRYAEPLLFVLLRRAKPVDPLFRATRGTARLSQEGRARARRPQPHPFQYAADVVALGREQAALDFDPGNRQTAAERFRNRPCWSARSASSTTHRPLISKARKISPARCSTRRYGPTTSSSTASTSPSSAPARPRCSSCLRIADRVASVTVYQRSAQWSRPVAGYSDPITEGAQWLLAHLPFYVQWYRFNMFWRYGDGLLPFLRKDPDWPHPERAVNKGNDRHREELTDFILSELKDRPDLIEKCVPTYPPYGKRILLDNGWFRTLTKPNVELVTDTHRPFRAATASSRPTANCGPPMSS